MEPVRSPIPPTSLSETAERLALPPQGERILRSIAPVVLGPLLPADDAARAAALDAGMIALDDYLAHMSLPLQREVCTVFRVLDSFPARLLLLGTGRRWADVAPERVEGFLRRARHSRLAPLRRFYVFLQSMTVIAWFDLPAAWNDIGYPGPPMERRPLPGAPA